MDKSTARSIALRRAWVIPYWLRMLPPFNQLVYVKRTYQNSWTSNVRIIVLMRKRSSETKISMCEGRDVIYAGSAWQKACLCLKTFFCHRFWRDFVQEIGTAYVMK